MSRKVYGIGTWLIDYIKEVEHFPIPNQLTHISSEHTAGGGGSFNVLMNLAGLDNNLDLYALGRIGKDEAGNFIQHKLKERKINTELLEEDEKNSTVYSIVLSEKEHNQRTFLLHRSDIDKHYSMDSFKPFFQHSIEGAVLYIGYINFIEGLTEKNKNGHILLSEFLPEVKKRQCRIIADCVSIIKNRGHFRTTLYHLSSYLDVLVMNEVELGILEHTDFRKNNGTMDYHKLEKTIRGLTALTADILVVHFPEGAYMKTNNSLVYKPSIPLSPGDIVGTVGAGDAFCAGIISGIMDKKTPEEILLEAHAMAWFNLRSVSSTGIHRPISAVRDFAYGISRG